MTPGPRYKICPQCKEGALLTAQTCAKCGHIFRTKFALRAVPGKPPIATTPGLPPILTPAPKKRVVWPYAAAGGLLVLFAIGGMALPAGEKAKPKESPAWLAEKDGSYYIAGILSNQNTGIGFSSNATEYTVDGQKVTETSASSYFLKREMPTGKASYVPDDFKWKRSLTSTLSESGLPGWLKADFEESIPPADTVLFQFDGQGDLLIRRSKSANLQYPGRIVEQDYGSPEKAVKLHDRPKNVAECMDFEHEVSLTTPPNYEAHPCSSRYPGWLVRLVMSPTYQRVADWFSKERSLPALSEDCARLVDLMALTESPPGPIAVANGIPWTIELDREWHQQFRRCEWCNYWMSAEGGSICDYCRHP